MKAEFDKHHNKFVYLVMNHWTDGLPYPELYGDTPVAVFATQEEAQAEADRLNNIDKELRESEPIPKDIFEKLEETLDWCEDVSEDIYKSNVITFLRNNGLEGTDEELYRKYQDMEHHMYGMEQTYHYSVVPVKNMLK